MGVREFTRGRDLLLAADRDDATINDVCTTIVAAMREVTRFAACAILTTDFDTILPSGGVVEGFSADDCVPFWDNELLDPDFNKFRDMARSVDPLATLTDAVDGDLMRSPRYQKLYAASGVADELRIVFMSGASCLAVGVFVRADADGTFSPEELRDARDLVPVACTVLRRSLGRVCAGTDGRAPVVVLLDGDDQVTAITEGGRAVLDDFRLHDDEGEELPGLIRAAAIRARWSRTAATVTTRLCGRSGTWMRAHVSPMDGDARSVAITIELARPDDIVNFLLESYGLTQRETEIVVNLSRGLSVKEIAAELMISAHTVRDHVKTIYDKAGVNSRGELVAGLFTSHVLERFHEQVVHVSTT